MSSSQVWSDVIAIIMALLNEESGRQAEIMEKYALQVVDGPGTDVFVQYPLFEVLVVLCSSLIEYVSEDLGVGVDDVGTFFLMEQFKKELGDG